VAEFDQLYDVQSINLTVVNQLGASSPLPAADPTGDSEFEEALDVEWTHAVAPGARIVLVECNSNADSDLFAGAATAAALPGVSVVLMTCPATNSVARRRSTTSSLPRAVIRA
jgi:subtilase family serine protease